ncbi:uncharacterized protein LOC141657352 [Silene latifolia]|uniref:uncharacterized protein LOC141657351 n=1 Tax=Silene latifolia TaxID=37657 RepID=UPI003D77DEF7
MAATGTVENISSSGNSEGNTIHTNTTSQDESRYLIIKFVNQEDKVLHLRVRRNSTFGAAFEMYRKSSNLSVMPNFLYNGNRISPSVTPAELNFKGREQIDVFNMSYGG